MAEAVLARPRLNFLARLIWLAGNCAIAAVGATNSVVTHPYQGIIYITRTETSPVTLNMHIAVIDLTAPGLSFKVTPHGGSLDTFRQTTLDFLIQKKAQLAINANYFLPFPSTSSKANVVGLAASEGNVYSPFEPQPIAAGYVDQSYAILPYAPALNVDSANRAAIVHRDPAYPDNHHIREPVTLWNVVAGSAQVISNGIKTIPTYSGSPTGLNPINGYSNTNSWYAQSKARTLVGLTRDNKTLVLFTVDSAGGSSGMSVGAAADLLLGEFQVYNALNLDGGGSTTMAMLDPPTQLPKVVNASADNPLGRKVGCNLAVLAQPAVESAPVLAITAGPNNTVIVSWPGYYTDWQLQRRFGLFNGSNWVTVATPAQQLGWRIQVVDYPGTTIAFYRLVNGAGLQAVQFAGE